MDFQSAMETFAEAWVAANAGQQNQALALTRAAVAAASVKSPPPQARHLTDLLIIKKEHSQTPPALSNHSNSSPNGQSSSAAGPIVPGDDDSSPNRHMKLSHLQQQQQQQHQQQQPHQQQPQQQVPQQSYQSTPQTAQLTTSDEPPSPSRSSMPSTGSVASVSGAGGGGVGVKVNADRRGSLSNAASPTPNVENDCNMSVSASSQNPSVATTPKLPDREERSSSNAGSITCLPPAALTAAANVVGVNASGMGGMGVSSQHQAQCEKLLPSPASGENHREFDVPKVNSKSLPLHCVVESVHSLQASLSVDARNPWKRRPSIETDSYVIIAAGTPWCEIVQTALQRLGYSQETAHTARGFIAMRNWKPIPLEQISDNPVITVCDIIGELTSVVTLRIVILRSKPSAFGEIKDKLLKLLVLQSHGVLRSTGCPLDEAVLSQICRSSYQNPFSYPGGEISDDLRRKFDQWWSNQLTPQATMTPKMLPFMTAPPSVTGEMDFPVGSAAVAAAAAAAAAAQAGLHAAAAASAPPSAGNLSSMGVVASASGMPSNRESLLMNDVVVHHSGSGGMGVGVPGSGAPHHSQMMVHPAMHHAASLHHHHHHPHPHPHQHHGQSHSQYPNQKTRMRTSFDPEMELPKLQKWFQENPHPSRQQIQTYVVQLNALESRRGRKPLDVNNVVYWFKNARAAQKRAEMRGGLGGVMGSLGHVAMNGYLTQHAGQLNQNSGSSTGSMSSSQQLGGVTNLTGLGISHDYLKSPLSLKSEDIDTISQHSDDLDDDASRPCSPEVPLSLTTHERNRISPSAVGDGKITDDHGSLGQKDALTAHSGLNESSNHNDRDGEHNYNNEEVEEQGHNVRNETMIDESQRHDNGKEQSQSQYGKAQGKSSQGLASNSNGTEGSPAKTQTHTETQLSPKDMAAVVQKHEAEDDDLDMDDDDDDNENETAGLEDFRSPSPDIPNVMAPRKDLQFPMVPNSMFSQSFMYMSHYMPGFGQTAATAASHPHAHHAAAAAAAAAAGMQPNPLMAASGLSLSNLSNEERRKRNRTFIDPVTEVPKLEQWFAANTHPSHNMILKYTEALNTMPYRQKFPRLESKNVQFWFKNRRAKCKRLKMSLYDGSQCAQLTGLNSFAHKYEERD